MTPRDILDHALQRALEHLSQPFIPDEAVAQRIELICRNEQNKAGIRFILACSLAKIDNPLVDIRKPYTEIEGTDTYSGRAYDEQYIQSFVLAHKLPCRPTTAFLTPAWHNNNRILTPDLVISGRPPHLYVACLQLLTDMQTGHVTSADVLAETLRMFVIIRNEQSARMDSLIASLRTRLKTSPQSSRMGRLTYILRLYF